MYLKSKNPSQQNSIALTSRSQRSLFREGSRIAKRKDNGNEEADILVKTCCPNCRYVFKVVNENKLANVKKKMEMLNPILQQSLTLNEFKNFGDFNLNISPPKQNNAIHTKLPQVTKEKQSDKKSDKMKISIQQKQPKEQLKIKRKNSLNSQILPYNQKDTATLRNGKPQQNHVQADIKNLKNLLSGSQAALRLSKNSKQKKIKQEKQVKLSKLLDGDKVNIEDYSEVRRNDELQSIFNSVSSIENKSKKLIQIGKKYNNQQADIQIFMAIEAAKSSIVEQDAYQLCKYVDNNTYTPSYIKSLNNFYQN